MTTHKLTACVVAIAMLLTALPAIALPDRGEPAPSFTAIDINGNRVALDDVVADADQLMVVLFFFSVERGETLARRLRTLDTLYGKEAPVQRIEIIGVGYREDEAALRRFAENLNIRYFIVESGDDTEIATGYGPIQTVPLTFLIDDDKLVMSVLRGGGAGEARILSRIAEQYLTKEPATAAGIAQSAIEEGEDAADAGVIQGYGLAFSGQLSEAEEAFGILDHKTGLAHVAVERGDLEQAQLLAEEAIATDPYAHAVKGRALLLSGQASEAAASFERIATIEEVAEWQRSQAINGQGRAVHAIGDIESAVDLYEQAGSLDKYNIVALSNQGAAYRDLGQPEQAREVLEAASARSRDDALIATMLRQVTQELEERNDAARQERIRQRISDLGERWREMQESGEADERDTWSSRPSVVAFLPSRNPGSVIFERAGLDFTLRQEVTALLDARGDVTVVDRDLLDELLRELELSDAIGDPNTQLQLGRLLAARALATVDFASDGGGKGRMFVRLVDTETTGVLGTHSFEVPQTADVNAISEAIVENLAADLAKRDGRLQGLVAGIRGDEVVLNLGSAHGVSEGMRFHVLFEEEPMEVGGRTIPGRRVAVGTLEVTDVYDEFASAATVVSLDNDAELAAEMKILAAAE